MDDFERSAQHCEISYRLLALLGWLAENEQEALMRLVTRSVESGVEKFTYLPDVNDHDAHLSDAQLEELQNGMIDFFCLMDALLSHAAQQTKPRKKVKRSLIPTVSRIDSVECGDKLVQVSAARAATLIENNPRKDPKQILFQELLRQWKPAKKLAVN